MVMIFHMEQGIQVEQKTRVSQAVGLAVVFGIGAAAVAGFMFFGSKLSKESTTTQQYAATTTGNIIDLTTQETPKIDDTSAAYTQAVTAATSSEADVTLRITSPTEGAIVNGATDVTVELTDPNHKATAVRVLLFSDSLPAYLNGSSLGNDTTPPYTFNPRLGMYPSGEYTYVAQAVKIEPNVEPKVLASSDTMTTWARTCYYLAYQDMTLTAPTDSVKAGTSFTVTGTVKNKQRGNCQHVYDLSTTNPIGYTSWLPTGWTGTVEPMQMNLGINETRPYALTVNVPANTPAGTYSVGVSSKLQSTGFIVTEQVDVNVVRPTTGGGGSGPIKIPVE